MRQPFLAVGFAVLISMLLAPHAHYWGFLGETFYVSAGSYTPNWCRYWYWFPIFWIEGRNPILWGNFAGQTAFAAVLAAVLVNLRKPRTKNNFAAKGAQSHT